MKARKIKLTVEQAKELYQKDKEFRGTILSEFTDDELGIDDFPKSWDDLGMIDGAFVNGDSDIFSDGISLAPFNENKNIFPTKADAEKCLAESQLKQIAFRLNGGDFPTEKDWGDIDVNKYHIYYNYSNNRLTTNAYNCASDGQIFFKSRKHAERSIVEHKDLWKKYFKL